MGKSIATRAGNAKLTIIHVRTSTARETESAAAGFRMYSYPGIIYFICLFVSTSFLFLKNSVYFYFKSHLNICCKCCFLRNNYIALFKVKVIKTNHKNCDLKGLGHAILGNFSTDQIVIELTKI